MDTRTSFFVTVAAFVFCTAFPLSPAATASPDMPAIDPPKITLPDETALDVELTVGAGKGERDFETITAALREAGRHARAGQSVRIRIAPGVYPETLEISSHGDTPPLLILESTGPEMVTVCGGEVLGEWQVVAGSPGRWQHRLPASLPVQANPWPGLMPTNVPHFRHELLFWDGTPLFLAMSEEELRPGSYLIDEDGGRILLVPPTGGDPRKTTLMASVRPTTTRGTHSKLLRIYHRDNVVVRGIRFRYAMTEAFQGAVQVLGSTGILLEDCEMVHNSGAGLLINPTRDRPAANIVLRRVRANENGFIGIVGGFHDGVMEDCETSDNNRRGARFGATGWAPCGFKLSGLERVRILNHRANRNFASGAWFDDEIRHVHVEGLVAVGNYRAGLSTEAVRGPMRIVNAVLAGNSGGWNLFDSTDVTVSRSVILDNASYQIRLAGSTPLTEEALAEFRQEWRRRRLSKRTPPMDVRLFESKVGVSSAGSADARLLHFGMRERAFTLPDGESTLRGTIRSLRFSGNTYAHPKGEGAALFPDLTDTPIPLQAWKALVQPADADAVWDASPFEAYARDLAAEHGTLKPVRIAEPETGKATSDELER